MDLSDEALIINFRQTKDSTYFKTLVRRYEHRIFTAVHRIIGNTEEAEEIVQDTFLKLHQNIDKFKSNASFAAWLFRIAHNSCMDRMRGKQRRRVFHFLSFDPASSDDESDDASIVSQLADPGPCPAVMLASEEQTGVIVQSLAQLPDMQRLVVVLHDIEGFSYQEISEIIGANLGTVRSRLHYGRLKLRELLEPYFQQQDVQPASR